MQPHSKTSFDSFTLENEGGQYEVYVNLPITYGTRPQKRYPVLYALDGNLLFGNVCDTVRISSIARVLYPDLEIHGAGTPEMIVVGIGYPGTDAEGVARETTLRRIYDYTARTVPGSPLQAHCLEVSPKYRFGGADAFFRLLTETIRDQIESRYRVDTSTRLLFGGSAGGHFASYALFRQPEAFTDYIIASPAVELCGEDIYAQEAEHASRHKDLAAGVFLSFGTRELDGMAGISVASSTTRLFESLLKRNYPSLRLKHAILSGEYHESAVQAALPRGLEALVGNLRGKS